jgi:hypothetical protein
MYKMGGRREAGRQLAEVQILTRYLLVQSQVQSSHTAVMVSSSFLLFLASTASAAVLESLNAVPAGWKYTSAAERDEPIRLQIALKQGDVAAFEQRVIDISTPGTFALPIMSNASICDGSRTVI